jgi:hypothetical protein
VIATFVLPVKPDSVAETATGPPGATPVIRPVLDTRTIDGIADSHEALDVIFAVVPSE